MGVQLKSRVALLEDQELRLSLAFGTHVKQFLQIF